MSRYVVRLFLRLNLAVVQGLKENVKFGIMGLANWTYLKRKAF